MIEIGLSKKEIIEDFQLFDENDFKEYPLVILPIINDQPSSPIYLRSQNRSKEYIIGIKTNEENVITNIFFPYTAIMRTNASQNFTDKDINDSLEILLNNNFNGTLNLSTLKKY